MQGDDAALEAIRQRRLQELMAKHGYQVISLNLPRTLLRPCMHEPTRRSDSSHLRPLLNEHERKLVRRELRNLAAVVLPRTASHARWCTML